MKEIQPKLKSDSVIVDANCPGSAQKKHTVDQKNCVGETENQDVVMTEGRCPPLSLDALWNNTSATLVRASLSYKPVIFQRCIQTAIHWSYS